MARTLEQLDDAVARIETALIGISQWIAARDAELGPVVDTEAAPMRTRFKQLGDAVNGLVGRVLDVPGGTSIKQAVLNAIQPQLNALKTKVDQLSQPSSTQPSAGGGTVDIPGLGNGTVFTSPASGPNADMPNGVPLITHLLYAGGGDLGWRYLYNFREDAAAGAPNSYSVPWICQQRIDFERSAISMGYFKPLVYKPGHSLAGQPIPLNDWDKKGGKGIIFRPGGQNDDGTRGPSAEIYGTIVGRNFDIGAARTNAGLMDDGGDVRCSGTDSQNPVSIRAEGTRQKVVVKTVNGVRVFAPA